jgi:hypothetical protein
MDYFPILPPFEFKSFDDMSKKEAQRYFDWFMETKSARLEQLKKLVDDTGYEGARLDYSGESLVYVWRWYLDNVELVDRPEEELREEVERETAGLTKIAISKGGVMTELNQQQMYDHFYNEKPRRKISTPWRFIARDIGLYLGECLIKKHEDRGLYWGFVTKKTFEQFKPAVLGLKSRGMDLNERMETGGCGETERATEYSIDSMARRLAYDENWDENALLDSFRRIEEFVYLKHSPSNLFEVREMNEKEAHEYFEWYVYQISHDIKLLGIDLASSYKSRYTDRSRLDYSEEALLYLWSWYLERLEFAAETDPKKLERLKLKKRTKKPLAVMEINGVQVYEGGLVLALDISLYFAELFRRKHEAQGVHWGYITEPKSLPYVNRPILRGFKQEPATGAEVVMDQIGIFYDLAVRAAAGERDKEALLKLYREWDAKV